jgi:DNA-binding transcriptional LysR family regulator
LTPAGEVFYIEAQEIVQRYRDDEFITRSIDLGFNETLKIGFGIFCNKVGIEPKRVTRVNTPASMQAMVEAGFGFSLVPGYLKESMLNDISIIPLKIEKDNNIQHLAASLLSNNNKPVQAFMKMLCKHAFLMFTINLNYGLIKYMYTNIRNEV